MFQLSIIVMSKEPMRRSTIQLLNYPHEIFKLFKI